ncbi:hypothetical protein B0H10DRAFT_2201486 [Mycena sp. CBHHK59/15]|nr:hypothetical protein B0H10DRAFT_2203353 [Mycena sp. CBHHK59/15]KAJ6556938.1 hypothetical protein B0H10DRAFT_2201486 [Mycena sp. CBHHK59/15]
MSGHKNLPKLAQIASDEGALTWILLEKLQKRRISLFSSENRTPRRIPPVTVRLQSMSVQVSRRLDSLQDRHVKLELGNLCSKIPLCVVVIQIQIIVVRRNEYVAKDHVFEIGPRDLGQFPGPFPRQKRGKDGWEYAK